MQVDVAPHLAEPALLDRIGEINRRRFLPAIEQVLDEFDVPGERMSIGAVHLALGAFPPGGLDRAEAALRTQLRDALATALHRAGDALVLRQREGDALVEAFEYYLLHGVWPGDRAIARSTSPADMLEALIEGDPLALVAMLRRRGPVGVLLRRLVQQMPDALLARLLHRLEPAHAAHVLTYLAEVRESHAVERLISASPAELAEMLWTIVLRDALQETGLQANRKAFLRRLLVQLARSGGAALPALIAQLRRGLSRTVARRRTPGSLVAILEELIVDEPDLIVEGSALAQLASLLGRARRLSTRERRSAARLATTVAPDQLRWLLHRLARADPRGLTTTIEDVLPFARALALLWDIDADGLPAALDGLAGSPAERHALLGLAARSMDRAEAADRLAAKLIAGMRGARPDQIHLPRARSGWPKMMVHYGPLGLLATALAGAADVPSTGEVDLIHKALAEVAQVDPHGAGQLLRRFAAADPQRLSGTLGGDAVFQDTVARLLPPHLAAGLAMLDRAAGCTAVERYRLLAVAATAHDVDLPEVLLARALPGLAMSRGISATTLRARLARAVTRLGPAETAAWASFTVSPAQAVRRLASRHSALEQFALLWREPMGLAPPERAAAIARLLPSLTGIARGALDARLRAASPTKPAVAPPRLLAALPLFALRRMALLLGTPKADLRSRPPDRVAAALADRIADGTPSISAASAAPSLSPPGQCPPAEDMPSVHPAAMAERAFQTSYEPMAAPPEAPASRTPKIAEKADRSGTADPRVKASHRRTAALIKARPFALLRLLANAADPPTQIVPLLEDPQSAPLLFASMATGERARISRLLALLTGRKGRLTIVPAKVAQALAQAAIARDWRAASGRGFAAEWLRRLTGLASLSEQAALRRLIGDLSPREAIEPAKAGIALERASAGNVLDIARVLLGLQSNASTAAILRALARSRDRARLARELGEGELVRLLAALAPATAAGLLHAAERLAAARRAAGAPIDRVAQWHCILTAAGSARPIPCLISEFLDGAEGTPQLAAPARKRSEALLVAALEGMRDAPLKIALDLRAREHRARAAEARETTTGEAKIHIHNAGLVLATAFLPHLFRSLDYLEPEGSGSHWADETCPARAVHLLQWLVDERTDAPEPQLALNKILCGLDPAEPAAAAVTFTERELHIGQNLLATILARWPPLAESSIDALRQTFFQREGRVALCEQGWSLEVETRVLDILLDQLPWGISTILHPWMDKPLTVRWR